MVSLTELHGKKLYIDANVFIYALEQLEPWRSVSQSILQMVDDGLTHSLTSELTLAECLIKPIRQNQPENIRAFEQALDARSGFSVVPVSRDILRHSARLRATTSLKMPDAIHVATALANACDVLITNDVGLLQLNSIAVVSLSSIKN